MVGALGLVEQGDREVLHGDRAVALVVLQRDAASHGLVQPAGADGCLNATGIDGCMMVQAMARPFAVAVSRDGRQLYLGSLTGPLLGFAT